MDRDIVFISNKSSVTIGGVQSIMRLIEDYMPNRNFVELPLFYFKDEKANELSENVKLIKPSEYVFRDTQIKKGSIIIIFGVQKMVTLSNETLKNNEVIIFQSTRPDITFGMKGIKEVPLIFRKKIKYIDKFLFFTKEDEKEIKAIIENTGIQCDFRSYIVPNPSKTKRNQITKFTNNAMYLGRFEIMQKNIMEYMIIADKISPEYNINAYGYGSCKFLLEASNVNVHAPIRDISEVAEKNSVLLLLSASEGFGNVLIEAFSVGMPVVVYNSYPAAKSIVEEGAGILVEYGDREGVINAIKTILKDKETFKKYSDGAFEASKKYKRDFILYQYKKVIEDII